MSVCVILSRNLMAPAPLMGEEKGVRNGQIVHFDQIKGQNAARTNDVFPYYMFPI